MPLWGAALKGEIPERNLLIIQKKESKMAKEYKVGNKTAKVNMGWLLNPEDFKYNIKNVHGQWMSDTGAAKEIAKEWNKRFAGSVGELNNYIVLIDENGDEISDIGGWAYCTRYNAGNEMIDVEIIYV